MGRALLNTLVSTVLFAERAPRLIVPRAEKIEIGLPVWITPNPARPQPSMMRLIAVYRELNRCPLPSGIGT